MYRLVVIDDEYIVVEGIKAMIARKKLEYEVVGCAYDGIHGLEVIRENKARSGHHGYSYSRYGRTFDD